MFCQLLYILFSPTLHNLRKEMNYEFFSMPALVPPRRQKAYFNAMEIIDNKQRCHILSGRRENATIAHRNTSLKQFLDCWVPLLQLSLLKLQFAGTSMSIFWDICLNCRCLSPTPKQMNQNVSFWNTFGQAYIILYPIWLVHSVCMCHCFTPHTTNNVQKLCTDWIF